MIKLLILFLAATAAAQTDFLSGTNIDRRTLLIRHGPNVDADELNELHKQQGASAKRFKHLNWSYVKLHGDASDKRVIENYKRSRLVQRIEFAQIVHADFIPNDPLYSQLWGMAKINAPGAWDRTVSNDVVVAVIDTGIDYNHEDLRDNLWTGPNGEHGYTASAGAIFIGGMDDHFHGTHVAGTIAAAGNNGIGVAGLNWRGTKLLSLKFLTAEGSGSTVDAALCVEKMVDLKLSGVNIRVDNNSWGGAGYSQLLFDAYQLAENAGILSICACGNTAQDDDENPFGPASLPLDGIVSVLASDEADSKAYFSSYGLTSTDLLAPGVNILSAKLNGGYQLLQGTSMATPHVSGVCALMFGLKPSLTFRQCKSVLLDPSSLDLTAFTVNTTSGGRLNAAKATANALLPVPSDNHNPVFTIQGTNLLNLEPGTKATMFGVGSDPDGDKLNYQVVVSSRTSDGWLIQQQTAANLAHRVLSTNVVFGTNLPTGRDYALDLRFNATDGHGGLDSKFGTFFLKRDESKVRELPAPMISIRADPSQYAPILSVTMDGISDTEAMWGWHFSGARQGEGQTCCFPMNAQVSLYNITYPGAHLYSIQIMDTNGNFLNPVRYLYDNGNTGMYAPTARVNVNTLRGETPLTITADMSASDPGGSHRLRYSASYWQKGGVSFDGYDPVRTFTLVEVGLHAIQFSAYDDTNNLTDTHVELFTVLPAGSTATNLPPPDQLVAPNDLRAAYASSRITLTWTDTSIGEDRWAIEAASKIKGPVSSFKTLATLSADTKSYSFVAPKGVFQFRVKACKAVLCSPYSNVAEVRVK